jgi:hypothetical protein
MQDFECPVCMESGGVPYRIGCKSTVDHCICSGCELTMRLKVPATKAGRKIQCPMCRGKEDKIGVRTEESLRKELEFVYKTMKGALRNNAQAERIRLLEEENESFRQLMEQLMSPDEEVIVVVEQTIRPAEPPRIEPPPVEPPMEVAIPEPPVEIQEVTVVEAPVIPRRMCESGWRQLGACVTRSPTTRKCSFEGCEKRVCSACRECRGHLSR